MKNKQSFFNTFFNNRTNLTAFLLLFFGFIAILVMSLFIFSIYLNFNRRFINRNQFAREFARTVMIVQALPPQQLHRYLWVLHAPHLHFSFSKQAPARFQQIKQLPPQQLVKFARQHHRLLRATLALNDGRWLNIRGRVPPHQWWLAGVLMSALLLMLVLFLLCYFVLRYIAMPTTKFIQAAKRFGVDLQSPPMPLAGPPEIQAVIRAFNEMQDRIRRLISDRTQMLAAISHDLRTPITRLQLRAEYLKGTSQYDKAITDLKEMEQMIASILSFARDYATTEVMERFDVNALLESLCDDMVDAGRNVTYHSPNERIVLLGRMSALKRAFTNLIENAVKYGEQVEVYLSQRDNAIQIKISDLGPGIPETEMENVFAPFYRLDAARSPEKSGTGLGLAVARDIIRTHGGDIKLYNRDPHGLTVVVTLPLFNDATQHVT